MAERASFRAAAEDLHLSQPALSRRVDKLEAQLGAKLLERTTRRVSLTNIGRVFRTRPDGHRRAGKRGAQHWRPGHATERTDHRGLRALGGVLLLPTIIHEYSLRFPRIRVRIIDETANTVLNSVVVSGRADFGISFFGTQEPDVDFKAVLREDFVLAVRNDHSLSRRRSITWDELAGERYMTVAKESGNRLLIDDALAKSGKRTVSAYEVSHVMTLLGLVEAGLGVAAVPRLAMPLKGHSTLASVLLEQPRVTRSLGLICRGRLAGAGGATVI